MREMANTALLLSKKQYGQNRYVHPLFYEGMMLSARFFFARTDLYYSVCFDCCFGFDFCFGCCFDCTGCFGSCFGCCVGFA
jgi:hypothetical protein